MMYNNSVYPLAYRGAESPAAHSLTHSLTQFRMAERTDNTR
jgi:hypothetical protein